MNSNMINLIVYIQFIKENMYVQIKQFHSPDKAVSLSNINKPNEIYVCVQANHKQ